MEPLELAFVLIAASGMALSTGSCMLSSKRPLSVGFLNLIACIFTILIAISLYSGNLVLAPEFGAVMVQGSGAIWTLRLALIAVTLLPTLCYYRVRQLNQWNTSLWPWLLSGVAIGIWAATRLLLLNADDAAAIHVFIYDVWWPPLVVWLTACLVRIMLALAKVERKGVGIALTLAIVPLMARFALATQELSDPQSNSQWRYIEPASLVIWLLWVIHFGLSLRGAKRKEKYAALFVTALVGLVSGFLFDGARNGLKLAIDLVPLLALLGLVFLPPLIKRIFPNKFQQTSPASFPVVAWLQQNVLSSVHRTTGLIFSVAILIIPICFVDLVSFGILDRSIDLGLITIFWLGFSARLSEDVLRTLPAIFKQGVLHLPAITAIRQKLTMQFKPAWQSASGTASRIVQAFMAGSNWAIAFRGILLTGITLIGLIAVNEALNYHKLVVEPFVWKGSDDATENKEKVADRVSEGIVDALGAMRQELSPVLLITSPSTHGATVHMEPAVLDSGALQTVGTKSSDLDIVHIKIPIPLVIEPIKGVVRRLLDIQSVGGTIHKAADGNLVLLIHADSGETWKVTPEPPAASGEPPSTDSKPAASPAQPLPAASARTDAPVPSHQQITAVSQVSVNPSSGRAGKPAASDSDEKSGDDLSRPRCEEETKETDPLEKLIDRAAFDIANSDPSFTAMGLTRNWKAYKFFRSGLQRWGCYQSFGHLSNLREAIRLFRRSAEEDPTFAPAYYRLGIALQSSGDLDSAVQAFKSSVEANPDLVQAKTAEAQTLIRYTNMMNAIYRPALANFAVGMNRSGEARKLWAEVVTLPPTTANQLDMTSAYFSLCWDQLYVDKSPGALTNKFYKSYFFCSKAEAIFKQMPIPVRNQPQQKQLESSTLYYIGEALRYEDFQTRPLFMKASFVHTEDESETSNWQCNIDAIDEENLKKLFVDGAPVDQAGFNNVIATQSTPRALGSTYTSHALRFYERSLALMPDDIVVQCSDASARAYLTGKLGGAMKRLENSPEAHLSLAGDLDDKAARLTHSDDPQAVDLSMALIYYRLALREYRTAASLSPTNYDAINSAANLVWQWFLDSSRTGMAQPNFNDEWIAETNALDAVRLSDRRHDLDSLTNARDTLVEVLLSQGRNEEALKVSRMIMKDVSDLNYDYLGVDEIRWDYAQALLCDATMAKNPADALEEVREASKTYLQIKMEEERSESKPYAHTDEAFNLPLHQQWCRAAPDVQGASYQEGLALHEISYSPQAGCSNLAIVEAKLEGDEKNAAGLKLYVYGSGVKEAEFAPKTIQLIPPLHEHHLYFAQFQNVDGSLSSPIVSFDVPDDSSQPSCPHGHITLNFKKLPVQSN